MIALDLARAAVLCLIIVSKDAVYDYASGELPHLPRSMFFCVVILGALWLYTEAVNRSVSTMFAFRQEQKVSKLDADLKAAQLRETQALKRVAALEKTLREREEELRKQTEARRARMRIAVENIVKDLQCPIGRDYFSDPWLFPCGHLVDSSNYSHYVTYPMRGVSCSVCRRLDRATQPVGLKEYVVRLVQSAQALMLEYDGGSMALVR